MKKEDKTKFEGSSFEVHVDYGGDLWGTIRHNDRLSINYHLVAGVSDLISLEEKSIEVDGVESSGVCIKYKRKGSSRVEGSFVVVAGDTMTVFAGC